MCVTYDPNLGLNNVASHSSPDDQLQPDTARYTLTVEEAVQLFSEAGVPRSLTTVTRFCRLGDLDCTHLDTERYFKWIINPKSVE